MKIIPKIPVSQETAIATVGDHPRLARYRRFLETYGGGQVFPNTLKLDPPIVTEAPQPFVSVQSFRTPERIAALGTTGLVRRDLGANALPVGGIAGGDELVVNTGGAEAGSFWFWSSFGDGQSGTRTRLAKDFDARLGTIAHFEGQGMTPQWHRMSSVDDPPAVDLDLGPRSGSAPPGRADIYVRIGEVVL